MHVRWALARNPALAGFPEVVATPAKDVDVSVRQALAGNLTAERHTP